MGRALGEEECHRCVGAFSASTVAAHKLACKFRRYKACDKRFQHEIYAYVPQANVRKVQKKLQISGL